MESPVILSAVRTPIGKFQGGLAGFTAPELGAKAIAEAIRRAGLDKKQIDEVIMGNVIQAGLGQNPARQAALKGGCDARVAAMTINKVCGSGLKAVALAAQAVQLGESEIVVAGGMESMSNCPYLLPQARTGYRIGDQKVVDSMIADGLWDAYENFHMGNTGELVAERYGITREEQDKFAFESHQKAVKARKSCFFESQILPIEVPQKKGEPLVVKYDESPREDTTLEALAKLKPAFRTDGKGSVTAGNSSGLNDGAAALLLAGERAVGGFGLVPLARVVASAAAGVEPRIMGMGPVPATRRVLALAGLTLERMDVIELNEAFAAQSLACLRELGVADDDPRVNPNGGAIALGHPLGMSGARLALTAARELERTRKRYALCTMCIGVGQGMAMILERC